MSKRPQGEWVESESLLFSPGSSLIQPPPGGGTTSSTKYSKYSGTTMTKQGYNSGKFGDRHTPRYASLLKTHQRALSQCTIEYYNDGTSFLNKGNGITRTLLGYDTPSNAYSTSPTTRNKAIARFHKALGSFVDAGVVMAELDKTLGTFSSLSNELLGRHNRRYSEMGSDPRLRELLSRKGTTIYPPRTKKDVLKRLADGWLEYNFGLSPVLADVEGAAKALASLLNKLERKKLQGAASSDSSSVYTYSPISMGLWQNTGHTHQVIRDTIDHFVCKYGATYRSDLFGSNMSALSDFGLTDNRILPSVYELLPYSWLVDYFTNVGDLLTALSAPTYAIRDGWSVEYCVRNEWYRSHSVLGGKRMGVSITGYTPLQISKSTRFFERKPVASNGFLPTFEVQVPSVAQSANVAAVLASKVLGKVIPGHPDDVTFINSIIKRG